MPPDSARDSRLSDFFHDVSSIRALGIVAAGLILLLGTVFLSVPGLTEENQLVLTVFFFALALWLTKAIPYTISSVLSVTLLFALGIVDTFQEAVIGFASTLVFFLFLLLLLGQTIANVGLDERAAQRLLSAQSTPRRTVRSLAGNILMLSFLMPSAVARAVTFIPVVKRLKETYGLAPNSNFERSSFLVLGHVNPIASMALMTGGGMAIITSQIINENIRTITWVEWALVMIPPILLLYWLSAVAATRIYQVDNSSTLDNIAERPTEKTETSDDLATSVVAGESDSLTRDQWIVGLVMIGAVAGWVVGSFIGLPTIVPAIAAVTILSLPGIRLITADDVSEVSWGILFLIGAMFSILEVMESEGTLELLVSTITVYVPFGAMASWQVIATLLLLAAIIRSFFSTASAAIIIVLPVILEFGGFLGVNQLYLALSVLLMVGSTTFLPFNTTSVLLSFDHGPLMNRDVFVFGVVTMVFACLVIVLSWLLYWPLVI
ncbi:SLC13 family permease (plasmid) [Haloferacaceae archaeon DSL9]